MRYRLVVSLLLAGWVWLCMAAGVSAQGVVRVSSSLQNKTGTETTRLESLKVGEKVTLKHRIYSDPIKLSRPIEEADKAIVLVLDTSRSMGWRMSCDECYPRAPEKSRMKIMQDAANSFVASFQGKRATIQLVQFSNSVYGDFAPYSMQDLSADQLKVLQNRISSLIADGGTNTGDALRQAARLLDATTPDTARFVVLMTDGAPNNLEDTINAAARLRELNINSYAVSITEVGSAIEQIAQAMGSRETASGLHHFKALTEKDMQSVYRRVLADIDTVISFKNVKYQEQFPRPVQISSVKVVDAKLRPTGDQLKLMPRPDGSTMVEGHLTLRLRKGSSGMHQLDERYLLIDLALDDIGGVTDHTPLQLSYLDPFELQQQGRFDNSVTIAADDFDLLKLGLSPAKLTIKRSQFGVCNTVFTPGKIRNRMIEWSLDDPTLAAITATSNDRLQLKGLKVGKTRIVAKHLISGKTASAELEVLPFSIDQKKLFGEDEPPRRTVDKLVIQ